MTAKKITPTDPKTTPAAQVAEDKTADRKTASLNVKHRVSGRTTSASRWG